MTLTKQNKYNLAMALVSAIFFGLYSFLIMRVWLPWYQATGHLIFNWPDETANYFFTQLVAQTGLPSYFEPLNQITNNLLHTRTINVLDGSLVPMTFLVPLFIWAAAAQFLGNVGVLFLTPLLAAASIYLLYRLVYSLFKDYVLAISSGLLLAGLAPWFYFANFAFLPTIMFIFFLLAGSLALAHSFGSKCREFYWLLAVTCLVIAILIRPVEIVWLTFLFLFIFYINKKQISRQRLLYTTGLGFILIGGVVYLNYLTYHSVFNFGYLNLQTGGLPTEFSTNSHGFITALKLLVAPFGVDLALIIKNFIKYFVSLNIYQFVFAAGAYLMLIVDWSKLNILWRKYLLITPFLFLIITFYYGPWDLTDPVVKELNTISISYVRYFMPLYLWLIPAVAYSLQRLFWHNHFFNRLAYSVLLLTLVMSGIKIAFYSKNDGLLATRQTLWVYYQEYNQIKAVLPAEAIVITNRFDKMLFPSYRVAVDQGDDLWPRVLTLVESGQAVYYYTDASDQSLAIDRDATSQLNLSLESSPISSARFRLFKVIKP